jgi:asparagine synthase (glutamine-hydrolysing)
VHRRLAVIDLDERANQPFHDAQRKLWISFNGEIFNYKSLRKEISSILPSFKWRTQSDTEVLLAAYLAWGEACVETLNGQFAFAIWDEQAKSLFLARDPMGQKPLFYAAIGAGGKAWEHERPPMVIAFASELSALRELGWMDSSINQSALLDYLRFGWVPTPATIYNGAWKLPPGTWMKISAESARMERYFNPNLPDDSLTRSETDPVARTRELVTQAVKRQLVADVPLGCFLSGGVDSSIVAAAMKLAVPKNQPVMTFSIGFDDPLYDETQFAAEVRRTWARSTSSSPSRSTPPTICPSSRGCMASRSRIHPPCPRIIFRAPRAST